MIRLVKTLIWFLPFIQNFLLINPQDIGSFQHVPGSEKIEYLSNQIVKHEFPHIAAIGYTNNGQNIDWVCSGTLISKNWILSAANCKFQSDREPDVVQLGFISLDGIQGGGKYSKRYSINQTICKEKVGSTCNDVMLLKISELIVISDYIVPACLLVESDEINYNAKFHSVIIRNTSSEGSNTFDLVKKSFRNSENSEKSIQSVCQIGFGEPLEIKLNYFEFSVSYIVGINPVTKVCDDAQNQSITYTKVYAYIDWIKKHAEIDIKTDPLECAMKYFNYFPKRIPSSRLPYKSITGDNSDVNCVIAALTSKFLLGSATCLSSLSGNIFYIFPKREEKIAVEKIIYHSNFSGNKNDIALVRLVTDSASKQLNEYNITKCNSKSHTNLDLYQNFNHTHEKVNIRLDNSKSDMKYCLDYYNLSRSSEFITDDFMCLDTKAIHVPGYCKIPKGTIIKSRCNGDAKAPVILGLVIYNQDCGPIIALKIDKYIQWIDNEITGEILTLEEFSFTSGTNLMISKKSISESDLFNHPELNLGDECLLKNGAKGSCQHEKECKTKFDLTVFCGVDDPSIVCCPKPVAVSNIIFDDTMSLNCIGVAITSNFVVASAECIKPIAQKTGSKYSTGTEDFMIEKFIFHPDFDTKFPYKNNIALLKLETNISRSNRSYYGYDSRKCDRADNVSSIVLKKQNSPQKLDTRIHQKNLSYCLKEHQISVTELGDEISCYEIDIPSHVKYEEIAPGTGIKMWCNKDIKTPVLTGIVLDQKEKGSLIVMHTEKYIDWIHTVINDAPEQIPEINIKIDIKPENHSEILQNNNIIFYRDPDLNLGDECRLLNGGIGECLVWNQCGVENDVVTTFCGDHKDVVCCPISSVFKH